MGPRYIRTGSYDFGNGVVPISQPAFFAASIAAWATAYGLMVGMATGAGAISIESAAADVCTTPGEGGGTAVGGQPGGPGQITAHWSTHDVIFEPDSGPGPPAAGHPKPPVPEMKQGPHVDFLLPSSFSYASHMHLDPERTPLSKHWLVVMKPDSSEHAYSGCRIFVWWLQVISHAVTRMPPTHALTFQHGCSWPSISHGRQ